MKKNEDLFQQTRYVLEHENKWFWLESKIQKQEFWSDNFLPPQPPLLLCA